MKLLRPLEVASEAPLVATEEPGVLDGDPCHANL